MADVVAADRTWFEILPSGLPLLVLDLDAEILAGLALPLTGLEASEAAATLAPWSLLPRDTVIAVDGPGDQAFRVTLDTASPGWIEACSAHGGAIVFFRRAKDDDRTGAGIRGGSIRFRGSAGELAHRCLIDLGHEGERRSLRSTSRTALVSRNPRRR